MLSPTGGRRKKQVRRIDGVNGRDGPCLTPQRDACPHFPSSPSPQDAPPRGEECARSTRRTKQEREPERRTIITIVFSPLLVPLPSWRPCQAIIARGRQVIRPRRGESVSGDVRYEQEGSPRCPVPGSCSAPDIPTGHAQAPGRQDLGQRGDRLERLRIQPEDRQIQHLASPSLSPPFSAAADLRTMPPFWSVPGGSWEDKAERRPRREKERQASANNVISFL
jgi:hypothetical protein